MNNILLCKSGLLIDLNTNDLNDLMKDTSGWSFSETYGWSSQVLSTTPPKLLDADGLYLEKVRKVSVTFNSYFNSPAQSMHVNMVNITISDGRVWKMGTTDGWISADSQLRLHNSYGGNPTVAGNIINQELTYNVPDGFHITSIGLDSSRYSGYVSGVRGMKNFKLGY